MIHANQSLGQLATSIPGATGVFHQYKLDFCCGGSRTLAEVAAERGLDATEIITKLSELQQQITTRDWRFAKPAELVHHILERFHAKHREQLPEFNPACPPGSRQSMATMQNAQPVLQNI